MAQTVTLNLMITSEDNERDNDLFPDSAVDVEVAERVAPTSMLWRNAMRAARDAFVQAIEDSGTKVSSVTHCT
jgi:hypothetical protein